MKEPKILRIAKFSIITIMILLSYMSEEFADVVVIISTLLSVIVFIMSFFSSGYTDQFRINKTALGIILPAIICGLFSWSGLNIFWIDAVLLIAYLVILIHLKTQNDRQYRAFREYYDDYDKAKREQASKDEQEYWDTRQENEYYSSYTREELRAMQKFGLKPGFTKDELNKRRLYFVKKYHPDSTGKDTNEIMAEYNTAYEVLEKTLRNNNYA